MTVSGSVDVAMIPELRKTGIDVVGHMPWGTHFCLFYETREDVLETLASFENLVDREVPIRIFQHLQSMGLDTFRGRNRLSPACHP